MIQAKAIAILGAAGNVGSSIAKSLTGTSHRLLLMDNRSEALYSLCTEIRQSFSVADIEGVDCAREASWEADIIIVATPYSVSKEIGEKIRDVAVGKIVISVSQPLMGDFGTVINGSSSSAAEELQKLLPHSKVIKIFNTKYALSHFQGVIDNKMTDAFIAGNNGGAVETVSELIRSIGFKPVVVGDLSASRSLERMQLKMVGQSVQQKTNWLQLWKAF